MHSASPSPFLRWAAATPLLPLEQGHTILQQALAATADIYSHYERFQSLETLSSVLPEELIPDYIDSASAIAAAQYRAKALVAIGPRAPDPDALLRLARHAMADHIAEDLRGQARPQLLGSGIDLTLLKPPFVEPTTLDAMARATLEVGSDWSGL